MSFNRRMRRNDNVAGLKAQLKDKENEIFMLSQQQDMQKTYFDEVTKISTALKNILIKKAELSEEDVMKLLEVELDTAEAAEIDEVIKSESVEPPVDIIEKSEIPDEIVSLPIEEIMDNPEPKKPRKKKESKK